MMLERRLRGAWPHLKPWFADHRTMRNGVRSGWSALVCAGAGVVSVWVGMSHAPAWDWVQYLGVILVVVAALLGGWSVLRSRRLIVIALAIVACIPLALF